jgi:hypothetical protein
VIHSKVPGGKKGEKAAVNRLLQSREETKGIVIASAAKQSRGDAKEELDCFVATLLAMNRM